MSATTVTPKEKVFGVLNFVTLILSVYVLLALLADTIFRLDPEVSKVIAYVDDIICIIFLLDFIIRFIKAENKLDFIKWGWIDLLSSIPVFDFLRPGRALRLFRLLRILRAFRSTKVLANHIFQNRTQGTFTTVSVVAVLMIIFSSIAILQVETATNSNIKSAEEALWWSYVTITTVGYGDKYPITMEGRIIAAALMTTGVGLFGTFTGFVANWFMNGKQP
jgi:voltage-gated potassium channel